MGHRNIREGRHMGVGKLLGILTLTAIMVGVFANLHDIRRYVRMSTM